MAYIRKTEPGLSQSGTLGQGAVTTGTGATQAGSPTSFTNIQDYLSANKGTPQIQQRIQAAGQKDIEQGKSNVQGQVAKLSQLPTGLGYDQAKFGEALGKDDYESIRQGAMQSYTPQDVSAQFKNVESGLKGIQPGSFQSLSSYLGSNIRPQNQYTQGQQKFDEMLLRGQKDFTDTFAKKQQEQFKSQVTDPLEAAKQSRTEQEQQTATKLGEQSKQYQSAIDEYLKNLNSNIATTQAMQQQREQQEASRINDIPGLFNQLAGANTYNNIYPIYYTPSSENVKGQTEADRAATMSAINTAIQNSVSRTGNVAPSFETAVSAFDPNRIKDYEALRGIAGQAGMTGQYNPLTYTGTQYNPGQYLS